MGSGNLLVKRSSLISKLINMSSQIIYIESEARIEPPCCTLGHSCACKIHARLLQKLHTNQKVGKTLGLSAVEVKKKLQTKPDTVKRNKYSVKDDVDEIVSYIGGENKPPAQKSNKKKKKKHRKTAKINKEPEKKEFTVIKTYSQAAKKDIGGDTVNTIKMQNKSSPIELFEERAKIINTGNDNNYIKKNTNKGTSSSQQSTISTIETEESPGDYYTCQSNQSEENDGYCNAPVKPSNDADPEAMNDGKNHLLPRDLVSDINENHNKDVSRVVYMDASDKENKYQECRSKEPVDNGSKCGQDSEEEEYSCSRIKLKKLKWIPIHSISRSNTKITPIGYWYYSVT